MPTLIWDVTFAPSYVVQATSEGAVAALAEHKKKTKYEMLTKTRLFYYSIVIETSGVFGPDAYTILCDLACRIKSYIQ